MGRLNFNPREDGTEKGECHHPARGTPPEVPSQSPLPPEPVPAHPRAAGLTALILRFTYVHTCAYIHVYVCVINIHVCSLNLILRF